MKHTLTSVGLAAILAGSLVSISGGYAAAQRSNAMSLRILAPTHSITITSKRAVTISVRVKGMRLDVRHIGRRSVAGHGHIQIYLDSIPSDATRKGDPRHLVVVVGSSRFTFQVSKAWTREHRGHHHLLLALAKNNNVLYHAAPARIAVTIK